MLFHYVEDNKFDAALLRREFSTSADAKLTVSDSLEDSSPLPCAAALDGILVDVYRPDSTSIEDDIARLRALSSAPIAFVTSGEIHDTRKRAIAAGAEGVFKKSVLSVDFVRQLFSNARERQARAFPELPSSLERVSQWSDKALGEFIRAIRKNANLNQAETGAKIGVDAMQIQKYESGVNRLPATKLLALAKALNFSLDEMISKNTPGAKH